MDKLLASDSRHMSALAGKNFTANATPETSTSANEAFRDSRVFLLIYRQTFIFIDLFDETTELLTFALLPSKLIKVLPFTSILVVNFAKFYHSVYRSLEFSLNFFIKRSIHFENISSTFYEIV